MHVSEGELKEFIIDSGLVAKKEIDAAVIEAETRNQSLGDILVSRGLLTADALRRTQAYVLGIPFVNLKELRIPAEVLSLIPEPIARTHTSIAFKKDAGMLEVALLDIADLAAIEAVGKKTGLKLVPRLTDVESIKYALLQYQKSLKTEFGDLIATEARNIRIVTKDNTDLSIDELQKMSEDLPIVHIVDTLLKHATVQGASDIHIEPMESQLLIRYRINGILHDAMALPKIAAEGIIARIKVLANLKLDEKRRPQDGRFTMETEADHISFRVSILPTSFGEKIVMRLLRETGEGFTLETLGFHGENTERVHHALKQTSGLILIIGPADSGRTTMLYTMIDILNRPDVNISTIEDPIEYQLPRINQTQVDSPTGFTFASGLRALMRQDPDIIMIGEIRDSETAHLAMNAVQSGRLVLAMIHAPSSAVAIAQLIELGIEPLLIASTLRIVIGERLVRKLGDSKEAYELDTAMRATIGSTEFNAAFKALQDEKLLREGATLDTIPFYHPVATPACEDGYAGRIGIHEILTISPTIRALIQSSDTSAALEEQARKEGMTTLLEDGLYKAARGITSLEEVLRVVSE